MKNFKVLVIDSDNATGFLCEQTFREWGVDTDVTEFPTAEAALKAITEQKFDLVMIHQSEKAIIEKVRANNPEIKILVLVSQPFGYTENDSLNEGFDRYLLKPIMPKTLIRECFGDI